MSRFAEEPFEVQPRANAAMASALQRSTVLAFALGLAGALVPGVLGEVLAWAAVAVVVAVPLGRVGWLAARWVVRRDWWFVALAVGLLAVVVLGGALAWGQRG